MKRNIISVLLAGLCVLLLAGAKSASFPDVPAGSWYETQVMELANQGLISGYLSGAFGPDDPVTAAQFVAMAVRCAGLTPVQGQSDHWAADALQAALQAGWYDWDELPPTGERFDQPITRQLAVKILMRALLPQARGDYSTESQKIRDFDQLDGRYYEPVLAAYASGAVSGSSSGNFNPRGSLSRAEACVLLVQAMKLREATASPAAPGPQELPDHTVTVQGGVSENGWLQVIGTQLCSEQGEPLVLRGMSSHGMQWFGQYASLPSIQNTAQYGANLFRVAMYTAENGYLSQPEAIKASVIQAVDAAIASDMYVILDWHILSDGDPMTHVSQAEAFFTEMAQRYQDQPAVLYEICNEPNGSATWEGSIKPYAQRLTAAIRAYAPRAVILVGSSTWSQDIHLAAQSPLEGENLMYTLHFYVGTHGADLRQRIDQALSDGLPVFVSEWGTSRADGSGGVFLAEAEAWLDFLDARGISWANWSLCDKKETSAALQPGTSPDRPWAWEDLTASGQFVFSRFSA